jgi:hypothetical protein
VGSSTSAPTGTSSRAARRTRRRTRLRRPAHNTCNLCNVAQWGLFAVHKTAPEVQRYKLAHHKFVLNGGIYATYREQYLDVANGSNAFVYAPRPPPPNNGAHPPRLLRVHAGPLGPGALRQVPLRGGVREQLGLARADTYGNQLNQNGINIRQFGLLTESEFRAMEDKLHINFGFGWASGDPWVQGLNPGAVNSYGQQQGAQQHRREPRRPDLDVLVQPGLPHRPHLLPQHPDAGRRGVLFPAVGRLRLPQEPERPEVRRRRGDHLEPRQRVRADAGSPPRPRRRDGSPDLLPGEGRQPERRPDEARRVLLDAPVRRFFPLGGLSYLPGEQSAGERTVGANFGTSVAQTVRLFLGIAY